MRRFEFQPARFHFLKRLSGGQRLWRFIAELFTRLRIHLFGFDGFVAQLLQFAGASAPAC